MDEAVGGKKPELSATGAWKTTLRLMDSGLGN